MKSLALVIGTLCLSALPCFATSGELLRYDREPSPPTLSLADLSGQPQDLSHYQGQVVLINFWATWCSPCLAEMPSMQRLVERMTARPFQILAVNSEETKSRVWKFSKLLNISFPTLLDTNGDVTRRWEVEIFPTSYLIDTRGQIRYITYGALEWDQADVINTIETLMPDHPSGVSAAVRQTP